MDERPTVEVGRPCFGFIWPSVVATVRDVTDGVVGVGQNTTVEVGSPSFGTGVVFVRELPTETGRRDDEALRNAFYWSLSENAAAEYRRQGLGGILPSVITSIEHVADGQFSI